LSVCDISRKDHLTDPFVSRKKLSAASAGNFACDVVGRAGAGDFPGGGACLASGAGAALMGAF
jgi:hypothetical protein